MKYINLRELFQGDMNNHPHAQEGNAYMLQKNTKIRSCDMLRPMFMFRACLGWGLETDTTILKGNDTLKRIGKGQCGVIHVVGDTGQVIKTPNRDKEEQLWNDYSMHWRVENAFRRVPLSLRRDINVPQLSRWIHPSNTRFWGKFDQKSAPSNTYAIMSERIKPIPLIHCLTLIRMFAPASFKRGTMYRIDKLGRSGIHNCLVRLYLGRRSVRSQDKYKFTLYNFDLMVNEMEAMDLDTSLYAKTIAQALAIIHWKAGVDGNDIEFVLGRAPPYKQIERKHDLRPSGPDDLNFQGAGRVDIDQRSLGIWVLDFNQCSKFPKNDEGVKQLQRAFYFNDPYYPRPASKVPNDIALWEIFKLTYLETSQQLTDSDLPTQFIDAVEEEGAKRQAGGSMFL